MKAVIASTVLNIRDVAAGWHPVGVSIDPNHNPVILVAEAPVSPVPPTNRYRILHSTAGVLATIDVPPLGFPIWRATTAGPSAWFVLGAGEADPDGGGNILDANGRWLRSFFVGDYLNDIEATTNGRIWIGFYDQGLEEERVGCSGLVCFDPEGVIRFRFNDQAEEHGLSRISDCYALNVATEREIWCYYMDGAFTLCRLDDGRINANWKEIPVRGASAFAVAGGRVLLAGSFGSPDSFSLLTLHDYSTEEVRLLDGRGEPLSLRGVWPTGRGSRLYFTDLDVLLTVDLADL